MATCAFGAAAERSQNKRDLNLFERRPRRFLANGEWS
jgi:hypothetical protein